MSTIAALILNYHQKNRTLRFLQQLIEAEPGLGPIFLVDNSCPQEFSANDVELLGLPTEVLGTGTNLGVAGGRNLGISVALKSIRKWDHLAMLDNDLIVPPGSLAALARALQSIPRAGIAGPCVVDADDSSVVLAAGGEILPFFYPRYHRAKPEGSRLSLEEPRATTFVQGGVTLYTRALLETGLRFDQRFNPYGPEDIDFCLAAAAAGFTIVLAPSVTIGHEGRGTYKTTFRHQRQLATGEILLRLKWAPHPYPSVLAYLAWKVFRAIVYAKWQEKWKAMLGALAGAGNAVRLWRQSGNA